MSEMWDLIAKNQGYDSEKEMWVGIYATRKMSIRQLSDLLGFGTATIGRRLDLCGVKKKNRGGPNNRKGDSGEQDQIRDNQPDSGTREILDALQHPSGASTDVEEP